MCIIAILKRMNTPKIEKYPSKKYDVSEQEVVYEKIEYTSPVNEKLIKDDKKSGYTSQ